LAVGACGGTEGFDIERGVGEDPDCEEGKKDGENTFEEDYHCESLVVMLFKYLLASYLLAMHSAQTLHLLDGSCQQTREGTGKGSRAEKQTNTNLKLMGSIEPGKIEHEPREKTTFEKSDKETTREQAAMGLDL
jgi:hypothetical protein